MNTHQTDRLYSLKEAAAQLSCSEVSVRRWIQQGRLPCVRVGRLVRIRQSDLDACLRLGLYPTETDGRKEERA
jgi:excisionase family DNA binding protein